MRKINARFLQVFKTGSTNKMLWHERKMQNVGSLPRRRRNKSGIHERSEFTLRLAKSHLAARKWVNIDKADSPLRTATALYSVIILYGAEYLRTAHFTHITLNENKIQSISRPKPGVHKFREPDRPGFTLSGDAYICRSLVRNLLLVDFLAPKFYCCYYGKFVNLLGSKIIQNKQKGQKKV